LLAAEVFKFSKFTSSNPSLLVVAMAALHLAFALALFTGHAAGVNNGLARTPQMGWVSRSYSPTFQSSYLISLE